MKSLCVYCGSSAGNQPSYAAAARNLGSLLAAKGIRLVYGGGNSGLMKSLANAVLEGKGHVTGVIPKRIEENGLAHSGLSDLRIVNTMHERKQLMFSLADGFIALPGGLGTAEELLEILTWSQLGLHQKPCAILNVDRYYDKLLEFLSESIDRGFFYQEHFSMIITESDPTTLLDRMASYKPPRDIFAVLQSDQEKRR